MMERLIKAGLSGTGLVEVSTPEMVSRYNRCLEQLGIAATKLQRFHIDCVGWSPEVAKEKGSGLYLSFGIPNQLAVILTPDQRRRPIYFPFNSFERRMINAFFFAYEQQIASVTSTNAIGLAIDQGLSEYGSIHDLLLIDHVTIRAQSDGDLLEAASTQGQLVGRLINEPLGWFDPQLRQAIKASARQHGDLRQRQLEMPELVFNDLRSFFSEAFGGVFVIRTEPQLDDLLIACKKDQIETGKKRTDKNVYWISDPKLVQRLFDDGIVEVNFQWFREHLPELDYKLECLAANALCPNYPEFEFGKAKPARRKSMLVEIRQKIPPTYFELERVRRLLERGSVVGLNDLSRDAQLVLMHPSGKLPPWYREVVWRLICRTTEYDPVRMYVADKNRFFGTYAAWPESKKNWAADTVARLYNPQMTTKE